MKKESKRILACAIDAEGGIYISKVKEPRAKSGYRIHIEVKITNTSKEWLEKIAKLIPSDNFHIYKENEDYRKENWKKTYKISMTKQEAIKETLEEILPYLIIKKDKAKKLLKYIKNRKYNTPYTKEELDLAD